MCVWVGVGNKHIFELTFMFVSVFVHSNLSQILYCIWRLIKASEPDQYPISRAEISPDQISVVIGFIFSPVCYREETSLVYTIVSYAIPVELFCGCLVE